MKLNTCLINIIGACLSIVYAVYFAVWGFSFNADGQSLTNNSAVMSVPDLVSNNLRLENQFSDQADIDKSYRAGLISKGDAMQASILLQNRRSISIYGKVVDQYGLPIQGVEATGEIAIRQGMYAEDKWQEFKTQTDKDGLFQFVGLVGADWSVAVAKAGYQMDYRRGWSGPRGGPRGTQSTPSNRIILTMWKVRGAEVLVHKEWESRIAYDGTPAMFELATGKKSATGDLLITLSRTPLKIKRGRDKYDWNVKIVVRGGGLIADYSPYPFWAPQNGYQPLFEASMSSNNVPWSSQFRNTFYLKNAKNRYGRLSLDISTDSMRSDTGIAVKTWMNPSGSENLEFDPKKQIH
jgi:hypothetical protein